MENWRSSHDVNYSLISAVCKGNLERAKELIDSFGLSYSQGYILLCDALRNKHTAVAKLLLTNGSKVKHNTRGCVNTPLHFAVMNGDIEIVMMILDKGADVNAKNDHGMTPLHVAVEIGCLQIVKHLLHNGALVNYMSIPRRGYTSLHFAVERGSTEVVTLLLSRGAYAAAKGEDSITPLHIVAQNGHIDIAEILLNHGACIHSSTLKKGYMPLHFASERDNEEVVKLLLTRGADIEARTKDDSTSLHVATEGKCEKVVRLLLQHGAKVDNQDKNGKTILPIAVGTRNLTIVKDVLKYCPDINNQSNRSSLKIAVEVYEKGSENSLEALLDYGFTFDSKDANDPNLLHAAFGQGSWKIVEDLLKCGADVNRSYNPSYSKQFFTPLHTAAYNEQEEVAELLISYGADINAQDRGGQTPIFYAIRKADFQITKLLLTNGANIKNNPELLNTAVKKECMEIVEALLQHDADVNARDEFGITALHSTVFFDSKDSSRFCIDEDLDEDPDIDIKTKIAKLLLSKGANVDAQTVDNVTTLHAAAKSGHVGVVQALLDHGADINIKCKPNRTALDYAMVFCHRFRSHIRNDSRYRHGVHAYEQTTEILKRHIVKMKMANLYVCEENLLSMSRSNEINDFQDECEEEIGRMKSEKVNNTNISFYDILAKNTNSLAICLKNEDIVQVLKLDGYKTKFPLYASMIGNNFKKGMEKKELLEQGNKIFHILFNNFPKLPYDCVEKIITYLSDKDLRNVIDACKH